MWKGKQKGLCALTPDAALALAKGNLIAMLQWAKKYMTKRCYHLTTCWWALQNEFGWMNFLHWVHKGIIYCLAGIVAASAAVRVHYGRRRGIDPVIADLLLPSSAFPFPCFCSAHDAERGCQVSLHYLWLWPLLPCITKASTLPMYWYFGVICIQHTFSTWISNGVIRKKLSFPSVMKSRCHSFWFNCISGPFVGLLRRHPA